VNGTKSGFGHYLWPNGSSYKGEWRNNVINGIVRLFFLTSREFKCGKMDASMRVSL